MIDRKKNGAFNLFVEFVDKKSNENARIIISVYTMYVKRSIVSSTLLQRGEQSLSDNDITMRYVEQSSVRLIHCHTGSFEPDIIVTRAMQC